jgi:hypothetical protein
VTDHAALIRAQHELADAQAGLRRLHRRASASRPGDQRAAGPWAEAGNATMTPCQERQTAMSTSPAAQCAAAWRSCRGTDDLPQADDCSPAKIRGPRS